MSTNVKKFKKKTKKQVEHWYIKLCFKNKIIFLIKENMLQRFPSYKKILSLFTTNIYSSTVEIGEQDQAESSKVSSEKDVEGEFEEVIQQAFQLIKKSSFFNYIMFFVI